MERAARRHLINEVADDIEDQIRSGRLEPRDRLPPEESLAIQYGLSRTMIRDALAQLRDRGYLYTVMGSGTYVTNPDWCPVSEPVAAAPRTG